MSIEVIVKNYRCFPQEFPLKFTIEDGFTSFVGVNNSGKSTVLKFFYEFRELFKQINEQMKGGALDIKQQVSFGLSSDVRDSEEVFSNQNDGAIEITFKMRHDLALSDTNSHEKEFELFLTVGRAAIQAGNVRAAAFLSCKYDGVEIFDKNLVASQRKDALGQLEVLCTIIQNMMFIGPFRYAIEHNSQHAYYDMSCGIDFVHKWASLKTGRTKASHGLIHATTNVIKELLGFSDLEIDASEDKTTLHCVIDGKRYRLQEMGSGLAHIIITLTNCALKKPSYILIDEPELNLHPTMQVKFVQALGLYTSGVMFATHSYGLARSISDSKYLVTKMSEGVSQIKIMENVRTLGVQMGELSYSGYIDSGAGDILMVEGSSSVKVVMELLKLYGKAGKLIVLPLGGSDMIRGNIEVELQEIKRLAGEFKIHALVDSERMSADAPPKGSVVAFKDTCAALNIGCHVLERRAMENYFTDRSVKKGLHINHSALGHYDKLSESQNAWNKNVNWRIAQNLEKEDLDGTDLGVFLESI
jgi:predicted ATPase